MSVEALGTQLVLILTDTSIVVWYAGITCHDTFPEVLICSDVSRYNLMSLEIESDLPEKALPSYSGPIAHESKECATSWKKIDVLSVASPKTVMSLPPFPALRVPLYVDQNLIHCRALTGICLHKMSIVQQHQFMDPVYLRHPVCQRFRSHGRVLAAAHLPRSIALQVLLVDRFQ